MTPKDIQVIKITSFVDVKPPDLENLQVRDLQGHCDPWGIAVSGAKNQLLERLKKLYVGELVPKTGCFKKMIRLKQHKGCLIPPCRSPQEQPAGSGFFDFHGDGVLSGYAFDAGFVHGGGNAHDTGLSPAASHGTEH